MPTLTGNNANNLLTGTNASDTIIGKGGNDTLRAGGGNAVDSLFGDDGNDVLDSGTSSGLVLMDGGNGNDLFILRGPLNPADSLFGGAGIDTLDLTAISANVRINMITPALTVGGTSIIFLNDFENLRLGQGNDRIDGTTGANRIAAGAGRDTIYGSGGSDSLFGEAGDDRFVHFGGGLCLSYGGEGNDQFVVDINTGAGSQFFGGNGLRDALVMESGYAWDVDLQAKRATVTDGIASINYQLEQIEDLFGGTASDALRGDALANRLRGFESVDTLDGRGGNDTIIADSGNNGESYIGGAGFDTLDLRPISIDGLYLYTSGSGAFVGGGFTSTGFERVLGGAADEVLGDSKSLIEIYGGAGDDSLNADSLPGGGEIFDGGAGYDKLYLGSNISRDIVFNMATGALTGHKRASGFEEVYGGLGDDRYIGTKGANQIDGNDGNDTILGEGGADRLIGGDGKDWIYGGAQNDRIEGRDGADHLFGGAGIDAFAFVSQSDAGAGAQRDVIHDYQKGVDSIIIDKFDPSMALIGNAAFSGTAFEVRYFKSGQDMKVQIDLDGDAVSDFEVLVLNTNSLSIFLNS